jgi:hypothetical protein
MTSHTRIYGFIAVTAEILANPAAMKAIADAEAGRGRVYSIDDLGE